MCLNVKKFVKQLIYFVFIYMMVINVFCDIFHLPSIIRYIPDAIFPIFVIFLIPNFKTYYRRVYRPAEIISRAEKGELC